MVTIKATISCFHLRNTTSIGMRASLIFERRIEIETINTNADGPLDKATMILFSSKTRDHQKLKIL